MSRTASASVVRWVIQRSMSTRPCWIARNHALEIDHRRVAAAEQRHFLRWKSASSNCDGTLDHAHQDVAAAMRSKVEAALHRLRIAGGVEDNVESLARRPCERSVQAHRASAVMVSTPSSEPAAASRDASTSIMVTLAPESEANRATPSPIGTGADNKGPVALGNAATPHRVCADGKEFDGRAGVDAEALRLDEIGGGHGDLRSPCRRRCGRRGPRCARSS